MMRPILRRRRPEVDPTPVEAPDRTHLHLDQIQAVADRYACDHAPCIAKRDQAAASMAGFFAECGVDLDDPVQLHVALAALSAAATVLTDVTPLADPVPAKGRQGLWNWEET